MIDIDNKIHTIQIGKYIRTNPDSNTIHTNLSKVSLISYKLVTDFIGLNKKYTIAEKKFRRNKSKS